MSKIFVLIGAPGAGKGTQARLLQDRLGIPQISTGDLFRELKNSETPLAREVQATMAAGKLISDELTLEIVKARTSRDDCLGSFVLDGYPRTAVQGEQLEKLAREQGRDILAIEIDVPRQELLQRLTGRRSCPVCGEIYNIHSKPPKVIGFCDFHADAQLVHREDDNEESVVTRLETYDTLTKPLIEYFSKSGRHHRVDGTAGLEDIYTSLEKLTGE